MEITTVIVIIHYPSSFNSLGSCLFLSGRKFVLGKSKIHKNTINFTNISYLDPKLGLHMDFIVLLHTALLGLHMDFIVLLHTALLGLHMDFIVLLHTALLGLHMDFIVLLHTALLGLHMDFIVLLHTALLIFSLLEQFLSNESFSFFSLKMLLKSSYHTPCIIT